MKAASSKKKLYESNCQ